MSKRVIRTACALSGAPRELLGAFRCLAMAVLARQDRVKNPPITHIDKSVAMRIVCRCARILFLLAIFVLDKLPVTFYNNITGYKIRNFCNLSS
jgi:hypothetical protein